MDRQQMLERAAEMFQDILPDLTDEQLYGLLCHPEEFHDLVVQADWR